MQNKLPEEKLNEKLLEFVFEDYKYYGRRFEQIIMIVSGFGLFACLELYKLPNNKFLIVSLFLSITVLLFVLAISLSLINIYLEKKIRGLYIHFLTDGKHKEIEKSKAKSLELENTVKTIEYWLIRLIIAAIILISLIGVIKIFR